MENCSESKYILLHNLYNQSDEEASYIDIKNMVCLFEIKKVEDLCTIKNILYYILGLHGIM